MQKASLKPGESIIVANGRYPVRTRRSSSRTSLERFGDWIQDVLSRYVSHGRNDRTSVLHQHSGLSVGSEAEVSFRDIAAGIHEHRWIPGCRVEHTETSGGLDSFVDNDAKFCGR